MKFLYILIAILILLLMITIHEFGHYIAGKILGFKIDEFSIGFGPKLFSKKKKNGELFSIRLLPLGGYCAFSGETEEENILAPEKMKKQDVFDLQSDLDEKSAQQSADKSQSDQTQSTDQAQSVDQAHAPTEVRAAEITASEKEASEKGTAEKGADEKQIDQGEAKGEADRGKKFNEQPPWKRIIVLMAGGVFNLLSAVIFSFIFIAAAGTSSANIIKVYEPVNSQLQCALEEGDKIISIDGKKLDFYHNLSKALDGKGEGDELKIVVLRDGHEVEVVTPIRQYDPQTEVEDGKYPVGMGVGLSYERASVGEAFKYCVPYTAELSWLILGTFGDLIVGKVPLNQVSGPIGTVNQMADLGMQNWAYFLLLLPLIAANLGIFNLFPIPALDGSKVVFTVIEWIRGKPINQKVEGTIHFVGLIVLFALVLILDVVNMILGAV